MKCIIIEKDPVAQQIIEKHIKQIPFLELENKCNSPFEAYDVLQNSKIDLIFIGIKFPKISGIEFIGSLENKPMVIFTTEYKEYAADAFELNAVDYLLKPISFTRFLKAANKAYNLYKMDNIKIDNSAADVDLKPTKTFIMVKSDYKSVKIELDKVFYIEGLKDYVKIYREGEEKPLITLNSLKKMAINLPSDRFLRVHKSYIVNTDKIKSVTKNRIIINEKWIPIGENYKSAFQELVVNKFSL